ncbi:MAG: glycoside hydrolase family 1 protein [Patescibacteria group bacterium]
MKKTLFHSKGITASEEGGSWNFPKGFLWGTATSAYQVEGGIENSDWSKVYPAFLACDHYNRYEEDFDLLKNLNQGVYRFSIEWSRIEPKEGDFDEKELEHYRKVLLALRLRGIKTMVTLHHFTTPFWMAGGWANKKFILYFKRFAEKMSREYHDLVDFWVIINEPLVYSLMSYFKGFWPPQKRNPFLFFKIVKNQIAAHKEVYTALHKMNPGVKVGNAESYNFFEPFSSKSILDRAISSLAHYFWNEYFLNRIKKHLDFIGLNYYFHNKIKFPISKKNENKAVSDIGWEIYPEGIYHILKWLKKYNLPIFITENGLADSQDKLRENFIRDHLIWAHKAIQEGVDLKGYFHWSLMDNFEWAKGFGPRFGLIEIDYKTQKRTLRPSALYYSQISRTNRVDTNNL